MLPPLVLAGGYLGCLSGFFGWFGSLVSRITSLFVQDIYFNGTLIGGLVNISAASGDINVSGNFNLGANLTFNDNQTQIYLKGGELYIEY